MLLLLLAVPVYAVDTEVQDLSDITSPTGTDDMYVVDAPDSGSPASRKIAISALLGVATDLDAFGTVSASAITSSKILDDTVDSADYAPASVDLEHLSSSSVDSDNIVDDTIESADYAAGSIDLEHMSSASVDSDNIVNATIVEADIDGDEAPTDNDILTFDSTGSNFSWQTPTELGVLATTAIDTFAELDAIVADEDLVGTSTTFAGGDITGNIKAAVIVDDSHAHTTTTLSGIVNADIGGGAAIDVSKTALSAGTNITLSTNTLNVDDAFLVNDAGDTMAGTLTADGLTLGSTEIITIGAQTITHNATDFVFDDEVTVPDDAYAAGWNGDLGVPTKNAVYDKIETVGGTETNDLETTDPPNVLVNELYIGTGSGTGAWVTSSGDVTNSLGAFSLGTDVVDDTHIDFGTSTNQVSLADIPVDNEIGNPTVDTAGEYLTYTGSSGYYSGGAVSANGTGVDVTAIEGIIRASSSPTADIINFAVSATTALAITDDSVEYIYIDYNSGTPQFVVNASYTVEAPDMVLVGGAVDEGGTVVSVWNEGVRLDESIAQAGKFLRRIHTLIRDNRVGGLVFADAGTNELSMTAGNLWRGRTEYTISARDTSVADTFKEYYRDGAGSWTIDSTETTWDNGYWDDGTGVLNNLANNRWGVHWLYITPDDEFYLVYGREQHNSANNAESQSAPSTLPPVLSANSVLAARLIFQKNSTSSDSIASSFDTTFVGGGAADHGDLAGLTDDDHTQYQLITDMDTEAEMETQLTDVSNLIVSTEIDTYAELNTLSTDTDAVLDTDIGSTVQAHDAELDIVAAASVTATEFAELETIGSTVISAADWTAMSVLPEIGVATGTSLDVGGTTALASRSLAIDTGGGFDINMGTASGDDLTFDTTNFLYEGDTGKIVLNSTNGITTMETGSVTVNLLFSTHRDAGTSGLNADFGFFKHTSDALSLLDAPLVFFVRSRGTEASPTIVADNDFIGTFNFAGYDGTSEYQPCAAIQSRIDGSPSTSSMPGELLFQTTTSGSVAVSDKMRIDNAGQVEVIAKTITIADGGTVTQATSKSTGVTLNTHSGQITTHGASLAAGAEVGFTVTNNSVSSTDVIVLNIASGATADTYLVGVDAITNSTSFRIIISNVSGSAQSDTLVINYIIFRGASS